MKFKDESRNVTAMVLAIFATMIMCGLAGAEPKEPDWKQIEKSMVESTKAFRMVDQAMGVLAGQINELNAKTEVLLVLPAKHRTTEANLGKLVEAFNALAQRIDKIEKLLEPLEPKGDVEMMGDTKANGVSSGRGE